MKSISVIETKYSDFLAELVYNLTGRTYTHAAISLDEDCAYYYSFGFKGFCRETIEKYRRRGVKKACGCGWRCQMTYMRGCKRN